MIFHENHLLADDSHEISYLIFFRKLGKMSQNLSSDAVVIGALRVNYIYIYIPQIQVFQLPHPQYWCPCKHNHAEKIGKYYIKVLAYFLPFMTTVVCWWYLVACIANNMDPGLEVIELFPCSTQLSTARPRGYKTFSMLNSAEHDRASKL